LAVVALAAVATSATAWQVHVGHGFGEDVAQAVAFLPHGDVIAGGTTQRSGDQGVATVVRLTGGGRLAWQAYIEPRGSQVRAILVDGRGDVVVGALVGGDDESDLGLYVVTKLDGRTGAERWRFDTQALRGSVALDDRDDVVVGFGQQIDDGGMLRTVCSRLDGRNGRERWRSTPCGEHVAIGLGGDVVATYGGVVRRLSAERGTEIWHTEVGVVAQLLRTGTDGTIVLADETDVELLDGDGTRRWRHGFDLPPPLGGIRDIALDPGGDVIVVGSTTFVPDAGTDVLVARLAAADGRERWRRTLDGGGDLDTDRAVAVGLGRRGRVMVAARLSDGSSRSLAVLDLDGRTGGVRWIRYPRGEGGLPTALAVDDCGRVAVGGALTSPQGEADDHGEATFVVLRLTGRTFGPIRVY
jgi:outer membrane protein assembly factor BamB